MKDLVEVWLFELYNQLCDTVSIAGHDTLDGFQFCRRNRELDGGTSFSTLVGIGKQGSVVAKEIGAYLESLGDIGKFWSDDGGDVPVDFSLCLQRLELAENGGHGNGGGGIGGGDESGWNSAARRS